MLSLCTWMYRFTTFNGLDSCVKNQIKEPPNPTRALHYNHFQKRKNKEPSLSLTLSRTCTILSWNFLIWTLLIAIARGWYEVDPHVHMTLGPHNHLCRFSIFCFLTKCRFSIFFVSSCENYWWLLIAITIISFIHHSSLNNFATFMITRIPHA